MSAERNDTKKNEYIDLPVGELLSRAWQAVASDDGQATAYIEAVIQSATHRKDRSLLAHAELLQARYDGGQDKYIPAMEKAEDAYRYFQDTRNTEGQVRSCRVLGYLYSQHGKFDKALTYLFDALKMVKDGCDVSEGLYPETVFLLNNIAFIYSGIGSSSEALYYFYQAYEQAKDFGGSMVVTVLTNIAEMHMHMGDLKMALHYCKLAHEELLRQNLGLLDQQNFHHSIGMIYRAMGEHEKALDSFRQSMEAAIQSGSKYCQIVSALDLARIYLDIDDAEAALHVLREHIRLAEEIKAFALMRDIYQTIAAAEEQAGSIAEALAYYKKYMELSRDIASLEVEQKLSEYEAEFKVEQAKKDAEIYRLVNIELRQKSDELEASNRDINIISEIGQKITASLDIEDVLTTIYENVNRLMEANIFGIALYDTQTDIIDYRMLIENGVRLPSRKVKAENSGTLAEECIRKRGEIVINDMPALQEQYELVVVTSGQQPRSLIYCPLLLADEVIGVITIQSYNPSIYTANTINSVKALASFIAIALNNSIKSEELRTKAKELEHLSKTDALTNLYNRRYIIEKIEEERKRFSRYGSVFSVILIDVDYFKRINDTFGHSCGDYVLVTLTKKLQQLVRQQDCLARWGGEEFLMMMPETDAKGAAVLAERLRAGVEGMTLRYKGAQISVTLTIGICEYTGGLSVDDTIIKADHALYVGKNRGRNCVVY